jgi:hypothetical protein
VHTHLSPSGHNTQSDGATLQWTIPGPVTERGNIANPCVWQARHHVMLNETGRGTTTTFNPAANTTPAAAPHTAPPLPITWTRHSGCNVHFPACFNS